MKTFALGLALAAVTSTAAVAEGNWENNTFGVTMISGPLDFSIDANEDGATDLEVGYTPFTFEIGSVDADVRFAVGTNLSTSDEVTALVQLNASTIFADNFMAYGTAEVSYLTSTEFADMDDGLWTFSPSAGVAYAVTDVVGVYGEVGYNWDMSNDWNRLGGYGEVGLPVSVSDTVTITPSISRTFDVENEATNFRIEATLSF